MSCDSFREKFAIPTNSRGQQQLYLCGHSLGLMPLAARRLVDQELDDWARLAVSGHESATRPWIPYHQNLTAGLAYLAGARPDEVVAMNSLTVNLHLMLASFYRPNGKRVKIVIESGAFSSDRHAVASQLAWHRQNIDTALVELAPDQGQPTRSKPTWNSTAMKSRWCCGPGCNSAPARPSTCNGSSAPHIAQVPLPASILRTPSATCRCRCTTTMPTSRSGAATNI